MDILMHFQSKQLKQSKTTICNHINKIISVLHYDLIWFLPHCDLLVSELSVTSFMIWACCILLWPCSSLWINLCSDYSVTSLWHRFWSHLVLYCILPWLPVLLPWSNINSCLTSPWHKECDPVCIRNCP